MWTYCSACHAFIISAGGHCSSLIRPPFLWFGGPLGALLVRLCVRLLSAKCRACLALLLSCAQRDARSGNVICTIIHVHRVSSARAVIKLGHRCLVCDLNIPCCCSNAAAMCGQEARWARLCNGERVAQLTAFPRVVARQPRSRHGRLSALKRDAEQASRTCPESMLSRPGSRPVLGRSTMTHDPNSRQPAPVPVQCSAVRCGPYFSARPSELSRLPDFNEL